MSRTTRIGLTGGIACGKSTVSTLLREMNIPVLDADQVAREVVAVGSPALQEIKEHFGSDVLLEDGSLNRIALRNIIIHESESKRVLETITHPRIFQEMLDWQKYQETLDVRTTIVEAALMFESGSYKMYDAIIVVACQKQTQVERLMNRNEINRPTAVQWIQNQMPIKDKVELANWTIWNDGSIDELRSKVSRQWDQFLVSVINK